MKEEEATDSITKSTEKKIWMNEFLDQMNGKLIIITNEYDTIHESVLRRFDYSIEFFPAEPKQRLCCGIEFWRSKRLKTDCL